MATKKKGAASNGKTRSAAATIRALKARIKELETERDGYLQTVKALLPVKRFRFTRKELREAEANPFKLEDLIQELENELQPRK
jgi:hypothetical protein